jgi:membrane protein YqaA with SNARE-associated domain
LDNTDGAAQAGAVRENGGQVDGVIPADGSDAAILPAAPRPFSITLLVERLASTWRGRFVILIIVGGVSAAGYLLQDRIGVGQLSYGAVAAAVLLASGGLVVPVPALAITCTTATFLNPAAIAVIAGLAGTLGELTGYFLGYSGSGVLERRRFYHRVEGWMRRRGWLLLFIISAVPNPLFDVAGIAAGALRYPLWRYLVAVGLGKQVKFFMIAYACHYSLKGLKDAFGV